MLREEIESVLKECGGEWTLESMGNLKKLDSFVKETLRHSGHLVGKRLPSTGIDYALAKDVTTATFQRKALRPITLSDGNIIPAGTFTFSPANAINFDPNIYPDAQKFDGLRFYNLRQAAPENEKKYQLTSITKTQMQFGSGRHACPGRWFASHQIKVVLAALLKQYDIKLREGEGRPKGLLFQTNQFPNLSAVILFKNRTH